MSNTWRAARVLATVRMRATMTYRLSRRDPGSVACQHLRPQRYIGGPGPTVEILASNGEPV